MNTMRTRRIVIGVLAAGALYLLLDVLHSGDPIYRLRELASLGRYHRYDELIEETARRHGVDPNLIKAVVWRESTFRPDQTGTSGERGLMQVMEGAATDWVRANKIETFQPTDLFSPETNVEVGTWYLARALHNWVVADDPEPYALAEYNAGRSRALRWGEDREDPLPAREMLETMDFESTRRYVAAIRARAEFYRLRGEFAEPDSSRK